MIVSHKHKFIFLKTNKTAGTSIEIALSKCCGPEDIVTPISPEDEKLREQAGGLAPQHYLIPSDRYTKDDWDYYNRTRQPLRYYNHMPAREVKQRLGERIWNEYYKFCFERNPFDRVISLYYYRCEQEPRPSIAEFIASGAPALLRQKGFGVYTIGGALAVDRVCKYERLQAELDDVCNRRLRLNIELKLPQAKSGFRKDLRHYSEILSATDRMQLEKIFAKELEWFGYGFETHKTKTMPEQKVRCA